MTAPSGVATSNWHGMAHTRQRSNTASTDPHSVSLKVLRLSRPSLAAQTPLPSTSFGDGLDIPPSASLAYPSADAESSFPLTPLLTLPPAFGAAYVGETFSCTLCANNELPSQSVEGGRQVGAVKVVAELQTPGNPQGTVLGLEGLEGNDERDDEGHSVEPGMTLQRTLRHDLKEEGPHVLAVTVTYEEIVQRQSAADEALEAQHRTRTFRKLYQFVAQQLIAVRSKVTETKRRGQSDRRRWILEAQLENVGEASVVLGNVFLREKEGYEHKSLNDGDDRAEATVLKPQDVEQVMFILQAKEAAEEETPDSAVTSRLPLAQIVVEWCSAMGEKGGLTTGWLTTRAK